MNKTALCSCLLTPPFIDSFVQEENAEVKIVMNSLKTLVFLIFYE